MNCRTIAEVIAAADEDAAREDRPLTQEQVDYAAALLAPYRKPAGDAPAPREPAPASSEAA